MTTKGYAKHPCYKLLIHKDSQWVIYNATLVAARIPTEPLVFGKGSIIFPEGFVDIDFVR